MIRAKNPLTFEQYLNYDNGADSRYELVNGELIELPPESEENDFLATWLQFELALIGLRKVRVHTCEVQVPLVNPGNPQNRYPDLVVLADQHLQLTQRRLTITLDMPASVLVAEVVSSGHNPDRDFKKKRNQYCKRGIPEYWLLDPENQAVIVLRLESNQYIEVGIFSGSDRITSSILPELQLTAEQVFEPKA